MAFKLCSLLKACVSTQFWQYKQSTSFCKRLVYSYPNLNNWLFFCLKHKRAQDSVFVMNNIKQQQTGLNRISETSSHLCPKEKKKNRSVQIHNALQCSFWLPTFRSQGFDYISKRARSLSPPTERNKQSPSPIFQPLPVLPVGALATM